MPHLDLDEWLRNQPDTTSAERDVGEAARVLEEASAVLRAHIDAMLMQLVRQFQESLRALVAAQAKYWLRELEPLLEALNELALEQLRQVMEAFGSATQLHLTLAVAPPSAPPPAAPVLRRPLAPAPTRPIAPAPSVLQRIADHPVLVLAERLSALLVLVLTLAVVAYEHPHFFAWIVEEFLRTSQLLLRHLQALD
jgi:hypothetical protein